MGTRKDFPSSSARSSEESPDQRFRQLSNNTHDKTTETGKRTQEVSDKYKTATTSNTRGDLGFTLGVIYSEASDNSMGMGTERKCESKKVEKRHTLTPDSQTSQSGMGAVGTNDHSVPRDDGSRT